MVGRQLSFDGLRERPSHRLHESARHPRIEDNRKDAARGLRLNGRWTAGTIGCFHELSHEFSRILARNFINSDNLQVR
jgi:hypothetical protein